MVVSKTITKFAVKFKNMKKILLLIAITELLIGCGRKHIYHTYYKDIDTDTMPPIHDEDGSVFYTLEITKVDSAIAKAMGLEGLVEVIFYYPDDNKYFFQLFGSDGGESPARFFNPETDSTFYNIMHYGKR